MCNTSLCDSRRVCCFWSHMFVSKFTEVYFIAVYFESKLYAQFSETFFEAYNDTADRRTDALLYQYRASALRVHCRADAEGDINEFATIKSFNYITLDDWFESGTIFLPRDAMHTLRQLCRHAVSVYTER